VRQPRRSRSFIRPITAVILAACALGIYFNQALIRDSVMAWNYQPTAAIEKLSDRMQLTGTGQRYFYANNPHISKAEDFNTRCGDIEVTSVVLGCYTGTGIYLYDVESDELDGIEETTAAHEMLHAAYDRLSGSQREKINRLLVKAGDKLEHDPVFAKRMSVYNSLSRDDRINELHSVVGTEVANLDPALEEYYAGLFEDRARIVALYVSYATVFADLQKQSEKLAAQLDAQAKSINARVANYETQARQLNAAIKSFNLRASSGDFSSQNQFDSERSQLTTWSSQLGAERAAINAAIAQYDVDVKKFNSVASHIAELNNSISSRPSVPAEV